MAPPCVFPPSDSPRAIAFVSFDACTADARGCPGQDGKWRKATGPKDFDVVAARDCDQYGEGEASMTWEK